MDQRYFLTGNAMIELANETFTVLIDPLGAQLHRIYQNKDHIDYLWNGDAAYWKSRSPILFPIVGRLENDTYRYQGTCYSLGRHGFAQFENFDIVRQDDAEVIFILKSNERIKQSYPFDFELHATYRLDGNSLTMSLGVKNIDSRTMYFSIGFHPGFFLHGINFGSVLEDYVLKFEPGNVADLVKFKNGLRTVTIIKDGFSASHVPLTSEMFASSAIVLSHCGAKRIVLASSNHRHGVGVTAEGFPYLGIWTVAVDKPPFICIEPWHGVPGREKEANRDISELEGMNVLQPNETFTTEMKLDFF